MLEQKARPPFARFEVRTIEDREASIASGHYVGKDVVYALVTPAGSRDCVEKPADEWITGLRDAVRDSRIPAEWPDAYQRALDSFIAGREDTTQGTPIKDWPSASPSQIRTLMDIGIVTVEHLAEANEETLSRIGMGGRALKEKAINWIINAEKGVGVEEITALQQENKDLRLALDELMKKVEKLQEVAQKEIV
jgi:hypothetical protein